MLGRAASPRRLSPRLARCLRVERGTAVVAELPDGQDVHLHPQWLRERCTAAASVQVETNQPVHQPHELPWPTTISRAEVAGGVLRVTFGDGHESTFCAGSLDCEVQSPAACGIQQRDVKLPRPELWTGGGAAPPPQRFAYGDIVLGGGGAGDGVQLVEEEDGRVYADWSEYRIPAVDPGAVLRLAERLLTHGHVLVTGVPARDMEVSRFAQCLTRFQGYSSVRATNWGPVFNVRSVPDAGRHDLAYTSDALPPHVDNPYRDPNPGFQLLHALENQCFKTGGSLAVDGFEVARQLREEDPDMFRVMCDVPCRWENDGGDGSTALVFFGPQISLNPGTGEVEQIRYSPKSGGYAPALRDADTMDLLYRARRRFAELLNDDSNTVRFRVGEGEMWIFNNLRVLHGRDEFDTCEGNRHFQGAYIDVDGVQSAYFRSKYALGQEDGEGER